MNKAIVLLAFLVAVCIAVDDQTPFYLDVNGTIILKPYPFDNIANPDYCSYNSNVTLTPNGNITHIYGFMVSGKALANCPYQAFQLYFVDPIDKQKFKPIDRTKNNDFLNVFVMYNITSTSSKFITSYQTTNNNPTNGNATAILPVFSTKSVNPKYQSFSVAIISSSPPNPTPSPSSAFKLAAATIFTLLALLF
ncbi:hypothetical protein ABPG74_015773 [Tetrahymena malaccensis]